MSDRRVYSPNDFLERVLSRRGLFNPKQPPRVDDGLPSHVYFKTMLGYGYRILASNSNSPLDCGLGTLSVTTRRGDFSRRRLFLQALFVALGTSFTRSLMRQVALFIRKKGPFSSVKGLGLSRLLKNKEIL